MDEIEAAAKDANAYDFITNNLYENSPTTAK